METRSSPSMRELRDFAIERGLKHYLHLSKPELFALLQRLEGDNFMTRLNTSQDDANKEYKVRPVEQIGSNHGQEKKKVKGKQRARHSARLSAVKRKEKELVHEIKENEVKKPRQIVNTLDPIMLTELGPYTVEFVRSNGSIVVYNVDSLVQYILTTGDFSEPETRILFSEEDLQRIDAEAKRANLCVRSVVDAKRNKHEFDEQKIKRDGILGLERCAGEYITQMLEVIENEDAEDGELQLIMTLFPSFSSIFEQIRRSDPEYAKQCMNHYKSYLRGPKNRPNIDQSGLLPIILNFLEEVGKGKQDVSAFGF